MRIWRGHCATGTRRCSSRAWFRARRTTPTRRSTKRSRPTCRRSRRPYPRPRSNAAAAEANLARLNELLGYQTVRAPFAGVITLRNVDTGALVNEGNTLLFRIAQTDRLRTYLNVPQADAGSVRVGQTGNADAFPISPAASSPAPSPARPTRSTPRPARCWSRCRCRIPARHADAGMYAQVDLSVPRKNPPLVIPGDTLVVRSDGPQVAVVEPGRHSALHARSNWAAISAITWK